METPDDILKPAEDVLEEIFGFESFRPTQADVITSVLAGRDTLAVMPTGGGKSLCYQIPALLLDGLTIVISPLISLMQDQVRQLRAVGIDAVVLNSSLSSDEYTLNRQAVLSGEAKLLYLAPETLLQGRTFRLLEEVEVSCITIDEAHCISSWGHDFRPEYRQIVEARRRFPEAVCVALTATATPRVRDDIAETLGMKTDDRFVASFDRPNLILRAEQKSNAFKQLESFIENAPGRSGIVYCSTRKTVEEVASRLRSKGYSAAPYHAGFSSEDRAMTQESFIRDDIDIIVATVAFGMGIDKPDVRFVVRYDLPSSIETFYQEVGRAGRDGEISDCLLLHGGQDLRTIQFHISKKNDSEQRVARFQLRHMRAFAETPGCRRKPLLAYFGEEAPEGGCGTCDNCIDPPPDLEDLTVSAQKFMSCIYRTGQRFGANHIIDVLRGSSAKKIIDRGHHEISTWGIGREYDPTQWRYLARQLLQQGLIEQDIRYGGLSLNPEAMAVLTGETNFEGRMRGPATQQTSRKSVAPQGPQDYDHELFEILRQKRKELADEKGVPPYVVFSNRTLREISSKLPRDRPSFSAIHGVGKKKLATYADIFIEIIEDWTRSP